METSESTKAPKHIEVTQLDDSRYALKNIRSGSVRKNIVIRLKSGNGKPSKSVLKNSNESHEDISKSVESKENNNDFTEAKKTSTDTYKCAKEVLDYFEANAHCQTKTENVLSVKTDIKVLSSENNVLIDEIEKRGITDLIGGRTENIEDYFSSTSRHNDSANLDRHISSTEIPGTHENKLDKNSEKMLICDNSLDYAHKNEVRGSDRQNACISGMSCENVPIMTNKDTSNHKQTNFTKAPNVVKSLKRCPDESELDKAAKRKKSDKQSSKSQHTSLEFVCDSDHYKHRRTVFPPKQSLPTSESEDKLPASEDEHNSFLVCDEISEDESWGIVIDSTSADEIEDEQCGIVIDSTDTDEKEVEDQYTELSQRSQVLSTCEDDKLMQQSTSSGSSLSYSVLPSGYILEGVVHTKHNTYYCKVCDRVFKSVESTEAHVSGRHHARNLKREKSGKDDTSLQKSGIKDFSKRAEAYSSKIRRPHPSVLHNGGIEDIRNSFYCRVCSCRISKHKKNLNQHKNGKSHRMALQEYKDWLSESSVQDTVSDEPDLHLKHAKTDFHFQESRSPIVIQTETKAFAQPQAVKGEIGYHERTDKRGKRYCCSRCNFRTRSHKLMKEHRHERTHKGRVRNAMGKERLMCEEDYERNKMEEKWLTYEDDYERTNDCQEMGRSPIYNEDYGRTKLEKERLSYEEDYARTEEDTHSQYEYYRSLDTTYVEEPYQNHIKEASRDNDYQGDILWNECYENFMRNIINRDRLNPPMNSEIPSPVTEHQGISENDPSFQPELAPTSYMSPPQQTSVLSMSQLQHTNTAILSQSQESALPTYPQPQLNISSASLQSSVAQAESAEERQANGASYNYLQNCVTNEDDAEIVINIIHSLLHTYLKYKLDELPESLLKLLYRPSKTGKNLNPANKIAASRSVKQLLIDLENHKTKFQQTFTPVIDNIALSSDHNSDINEKMIPARSNVTLNDNEANSSLVNTKRPESSINYLFNQYRNRTNEKRAVESCNQNELFTSSSENYHNYLYGESSSKSNNPLTPLLMAYLNKNLTSEMNSIEDDFQTKQNEQLATGVSEQYGRYNEYNSSRSINQNVSSVGTFSHQNRQSNHGNSCLKTTNQHLSSFINLSKK